MTGWIDTAIQSIVGFAGANPWVVAAIIFAAAFSEAIVVIGALVPGTAMIIAFAAAAGAGHHPVWPILLAATLGAIASDGVSFWLGHRYKAHIVEHWPFTRHPDLLARGDAFFERHGGKSVLLARFLPGVRAVVPVSAGISGMPVGRFYLANVTSALLWSAFHILPSALLGASLAVLGAASGRARLALAALIVTIFVALWLARFAWSRIVVALERIRERLFEAMRTRNGALAHLVATGLDPDRADVRALALLVILLGVVVSGFVALVNLVAAGGEIARADHALSNLMLSVRSDWADAVFMTISAYGDSTVITLVILGVLGWLLWTGEKGLALVFATLVAVTFGFVPALKSAIGIARPFPMYAGAEVYSFPSGHATWSALVYGFIGWWVSRSLVGRWSSVPVAIASALIAAIALARIYLGAHWPSDVLAGLLFGSGSVLIVAILFQRKTFPIGDGAAHFGFALMALVLVAGATDAALTWPAAQLRYARVAVPEVMSLQAWIDGGWRKLPLRRVDLGGDTEEPFTAQWAGTPAALAATLEKTGWQAPQTWSSRAAAALFLPSASLAALPPAPMLSDGREAALVMVKADPAGGRFVARFWSTKLRIGSGAKTIPVLEGLMAHERHVVFLDVFNWATVDGHVPFPRQALPNASPVTAPSGAKLLLAHERIDGAALRNIGIHHAARTGISLGGRSISVYEL